MMASNSQRTSASSSKCWEIKDGGWFFFFLLFSSHVCLRTTYVPGAHSVQKTQQIFRNWSYSRLWATVWVLGTEPGSSARAMGALNHRAASTAHSFIFLNLPCFWRETVLYSACIFFLCLLFYLFSWQFCPCIQHVLTIATLTPLPHYSQGQPNTPFHILFFFVGMLTDFTGLVLCRYISRVWQ